MYRPPVQMFSSDDLHTSAINSRVISSEPQHYEIIKVRRMIYQESEDEEGAEEEDNLNPSSYNN